MRKSDYVFIILNGWVDHKQFLSDHFFREYKEAEKNHISLAEFFENLIKANQFFLDDIIRQTNERKQELTLIKALREKEGKSTDDLIFSEKYSTNLYTLTHGKFSGHLWVEDLEYIRLEIMQSIEKIKEKYPKNDNNERNEAIKLIDGLNFEKACQIICHGLSDRMPATIKRLKETEGIKPTDVEGMLKFEGLAKPKIIEHLRLEIILKRDEVVNTYMEVFKKIDDASPNPEFTKGLHKESVYKTLVSEKEHYQTLSQFPSDWNNTELFGRLWGNALLARSFLASREKSDSVIANNNSKSFLKSQRQIALFYFYKIDQGINDEFVKNVKKITESYGHNSVEAQMKKYNSCSKRQERTKNTDTNCKDLRIVIAELKRLELDYSKAECELIIAERESEE